MDYLESKTNNELLEITKNIEKYILSNNYENAFFLFLHNLSNLNNDNRDEIIIYFKNFFIKKY